MDYDCTVKYIICNFQNLKEKKLCKKGLESYDVSDKERLKINDIETRGLVL